MRSYPSQKETIMFTTVKHVAKNTILIYTAVVATVGLGEMGHDAAVHLLNKEKTIRKK
jgi:glutamyl-tRNA reductase